jgi:hypothetical protein
LGGFLWGGPVGFAWVAGNRAGAKRGGLWLSRGATAGQDARLNGRQDACRYDFVLVGFS